MTNEIRVPDAEGTVRIYNEDGVLVRSEFPSGAVYHYKSGGHVRTEHSNGQVATYD